MKWREVITHLHVLVHRAIVFIIYYCIDRIIGGNFSFTVGKKNHFVVVSIIFHISDFFAYRAHIIPLICHN